MMSWRYKNGQSGGRLITGEKGKLGDPFPGFPRRRVRRKWTGVAQCIHGEQIQERRNLPVSPGCSETPHKPPNPSNRKISGEKIPTIGI